MDYSFLKLYNSIDEALDDDLFKDRKLSYYMPIQLSPKEAYSQQTNYKGGISFQGGYTVEIVDNCGSLLKDITNNVFIEEFTDDDGFNQLKIEIVNIGKDFYGRAVFLRFKNNIANDEYFTRPIKITDKGIEKTYRYDYWSNSNMNGLHYVNSGFKQSIRLNLKFLDFNNKSEVSDYRQSSTGNTISGMDEMSIAKDYISEQMDTFTFVRLQKLLFHNIIYIDGVRVTNKPILEQGGRVGQSNLIKSSFTVFNNNEDSYNYEYQIFEGFNIINKTPLGLYTLSSLDDQITIQFNLNISIGTGVLYVYDASDDSLVVSFNQDDITLDDIQSIVIEDFESSISENGSYYILFDSGLFYSSDLGIGFEGVSDTTEWNFTVGNADFNGNDFNNNDFFTD